MSNNKPICPRMADRCRAAKSPSGWLGRGIKAGCGPPGKLQNKTVSRSPTTPRGGGKSGGLARSGVGYIFQPFETSSSKQGVQEKQGGMIFEQTSEK